MYSSSATSMVMPLFWKVTLCDLAMFAPAYSESKSRILPVLAYWRDLFSERFAGLHPVRPAELSDDLEVGHHHHVLMFEVVAVEDVAAPVAVETDEHTRLFARGQVHGVLPAGVRWQRFPAVAGEHLEVDQVKVDRVRRGGRLEMPYLGGP